MGLTKQYLRYAPAGVFGVVAAKTCNAVYLQPSRFIATGGTHIVTLWDTRTQRKLRNLKCESAAVVLKPNDDATLLAVGHQNGGLSIYDITDKSEEASPDPNITFEGHTSAVNCIAWNANDSLVASGGKDNRIVVWNYVSEAGHCKFLGHTAPVTQVKFWRDGRYLVSSSLDATVRVWDMEVKECTHTIACNHHVRDFDIWLDCIIVAENHLRCFVLTEDTKTNQFGDWFMEELGTVLREGNDRSTGSVVVVDNRYLVTTGVSSPNVEVFLLSSAAEGEKKRRKRLKKNPDGEAKFILRDLIRRWNTLKAAEGKIKSIDTILEKESLNTLCCLPSNQVQILSVPVDSSENKDELVHPTVGFDGHRKLIRGIAFSGDKTAILTASADCFKLWNRNTLTCILTIYHKYPVVCCLFCPGDRHFLAGTTCGNIILGDISTGELIQIESGGSENVWSIDVYSNNLGFVASNGNCIQFCDFSMEDGKLRFDIKKQLDVQESVLSVKVSPDMKFVAAGLLDSTIKVFYTDTLKFHLSMYGHSLPVVAINISSDGNLLVSCSGDKSVRVWGMDFGDCHCTLMHTEGLVGCAFIDKTHHVVSVAKDSINFYDADIHQRIQTVKGHVEGGATCMATGGLFVATAGRDQAIRLFSRTQEILVLDDEREEERTAQTDEAPIRDESEKSISIIKGSSEKTADRLIEALQIFTSKDDTNPLVVATGAQNSLEYVYRTLLGMKTVDLEQSILLLPTYHVNGLFCATTAVLMKYPLSSEMGIRCINYLTKFHYESLRTIDKNKLRYVANLAKKRADFWLETIGVNVAALKFLSNQLDKQDQAEVFKEILGERKRKKKTKEKALKRAMLAISSK